VQEDGIVPYKILPFAVRTVKRVVSSRLRLFADPALSGLPIDVA
jgi:hypothetical protein